MKRSFTLLEISFSAGVRAGIVRWHFFQSGAARNVRTLGGWGGLKKMPIRVIGATQGLEFPAVKIGTLCA